MDHKDDSGADVEPGRGALLGRLVVVMAALVCFFFATTLRDTSLGWLPLPPIPAPPVPASVTLRDAALDVVVTAEDGQPLAGASVRVFAMREGKAYFAGDRDTDAAGRASFTALPRGEVWVLAY